MSTEFQRALTLTTVIILSDYSTGCDEMRRAIILPHNYYFPRPSIYIVVLYIYGNIEKVYI